MSELTPAGITRGNSESCNLGTTFVHNRIFIYVLSAENGISNEMANYLTMVFDPMAPSIRAAKTEKNSSYADRLANLSAELDRLLSSKNMTFLELMNAVAVRSGHWEISDRQDHYFEIVVQFELENPKIFMRSLVYLVRNYIVIFQCRGSGAMTPCHYATSITSSTCPAAGRICLIPFPFTRWSGLASGQCS